MNNFKYSKIITFNLIVASMIPFLIWGPFFPDLIVSSSALFFLYHVLRNKNFDYFFNRLIDGSASKTTSITLNFMISSIFEGS